jgi:adenylate cyclase
LLADCQGRAGDVEGGLRTLEQAMAVVDATGERFYEAELHRLKGTMLQGASSEEAQACFLKAIAVAREQSARSLALRAASSLARLWQRAGRADEARQVLSEILDTFTEGFGTADLREAKTLQDALVSSDA